MNSHGKSIPRIQSAPPDEGEPDLKPILNQNAQEFNPQSWVPKLQKKLNANANDYTPDAPAPLPAPFVPSYPAIQHNYNKGFKQKHYNNYHQGFQNPQHMYLPYHNQNYAYPNPQTSSKPEPARSFYFNADTPDFHLPGITDTKLDSVQSFELPSQEKPENSKENAEKIKEKEPVEESAKPDENKKTAEEAPDLTETTEQTIQEKTEEKTEEIINEINQSRDPAEISEEVHKDSDQTSSAVQPESKETTQAIKKKVYDFETVKNFKFEFVRDPNFLMIPEQITKFKDREVQEIKVSKQNKGSIDRKPSELQVKVVFWRKSKTAEEQKISEKAKEYTRRFTVTVDEQEKIKKAVKVNLNKLSPNNLEKLTSQILETCKKSHDSLKLVVSGIFEKAWSEKKYTQMYSDICKTLKTQFEGFRYPDQDTLKLPNTRNYFKFELLYMCEETFIKTPQVESLSSLTQEQRNDRLAKIKEKTLGNVRFIGELFNVNLITAKIVLECVNSLLNLYESENNEDRLEGACLLLQTGGASFERSKVVQETNQIYRRLDRIAEREISSKNRFKIMDLKDFRETGWKGLQKGLKKVEEIHADHVMEQEEIKRRNGYNN